MRLHPGGALLHWGENYPTKEAITFGQKTETYGELLNNALSVSAFMLDQSVRKGDKVAILIPSSFEYIEILYASFILGVVAVPLNLDLKAHVIAEMIKDADPKLVFISEKYAEFNSLNELNTNEQTFIVVRTLYAGFSGKDNSNFLNGMSRDQILHEDTVGILYSSGTTGRPKGIQKTFYQLVSELFVEILEYQFAFEKKILICTPLYYTGGFLLLLEGLFVGSHIVMFEDYEPMQWLHIVSSMNITHAFLNPYQAKRLINLELNEWPKTNLQLIVTMSDATTGDMKSQLSNLFHCDVVDVWGNTEGAGTIAKPRDLRQKPDTIGKPFLTDEVKIIDDNMQEVGTGEIGEIATKTDASFLYYNQPETTNETLREGWILSGDLGWKDEDGYYYFAGRKKTMLKVGGVNVYPSDIESVLEQNPRVNQAAVFGVEDEYLGEKPIAAIILKSDEIGDAEIEGNILVWANSRLSKPQHISDLIIINEFPRTSAGKIIRQRLLEDYLSAKNDKDSEI